MKSSTLLTVSVPSIDNETGEPSTTSHHLISTPLTYVNSWSDGYTIRMSQPPVIPYQIDNYEDESEDGGKEGAIPVETNDTKRSLSEDSNQDSNEEGELEVVVKKQKVLETSTDTTPAIFAPAAVVNEEDQASDDKESELHHKSIEPMLTSAIEAVRSAWMAREEFKSSLEKDDPMNERWCGKLKGIDEYKRRYKCIEWRSKEDEIEDAKVPGFPFIGLAQPKTLQRCIKSYRGELDYYYPPVNDTNLVEVADFYNKIVLNHDGSDFDLPFAPPCNGNAGHRMLISLPVNCAWLMSDFSTWSDPFFRIAQVGRTRGGFNLVVIDPPWPNKSVNRSSSYETFDPYSLGKLDLPALLGNKASLVAVWVTNKVKYRKLIIDQLFPAWGIKGKAAEWYWVKITSGDKKNVGGEPVWNMDQSHRRCYEGLILGYYNPQSIPLPTLPLSKVFLAVPIGHSRKPNLSELLRPYLPVSSANRSPNVLELFARNVFAGLKRDNRGKTNKEIAELLKLEKEEESLTKTESEKLEDKEFEQWYGSYPHRGVYLSVGNEPLKFNVTSRELDFDDEGDEEDRLDAILPREWTYYDKDVKQAEDGDEDEGPSEEDW